MPSSLAKHSPVEWTGTVFLPNGQPAAGAELVLQLTNDLLYLDPARQVLAENGETNPPPDGSRLKSSFAIANADGHFHLQPLENAAALLVIHPQGFTWLAPGELKDELVVHLQPLGRIEGTFRFGSQPGANEDISLGANEPRLHLFSQPIETTTDAAGHFVFTNLPAIQFCVARMFRTYPSGTNRGSSCRIFLNSPDVGTMLWAGLLRLSSEHTNILVKGGETTEVEVGGTGRPVIGKLAKAGLGFRWSQARVQLDQQGLPKYEVQSYFCASCRGRQLPRGERGTWRL